ncbi:hypothetical protein [uncultured Thiocystis sp.]|jgi:hypothetical protein|uniref:hypothetical protein n=1 Tax=uncultured Thiocystis sp. TaxID=1202134 RepID=UPI0025F8BE08|nr:hypothetical protein [uncultured Thiocystis sp.]
MPWVDRRSGYQYPGVLFSEDGTVAKVAGIAYRERPFSLIARRRFRLWLTVVLLGTFPGIPLLAAWGLNDRLFWVVIPVLVLAYWLHRRIHACPRCVGQSRVLTIPHMGAPVLYLCQRCRTFFEHGEIDGGWPWK